MIRSIVATHSVGFDKFADYVLGQEAGDPEGPKTPEWAALKVWRPGLDDQSTGQELAPEENLARRFSWSWNARNLLHRTMPNPGLR
jgi:hypothetical protein